MCTVNFITFFLNHHMHFFLNRRRQNSCETAGVRANRSCGCEVVQPLEAFSRPPSSRFRGLITNGQVRMGMRGAIVASLCLCLRIKAQVATKVATMMPKDIQLVANGLGELVGVPRRRRQRPATTSLGTSTSSLLVFLNTTHIS